MTSFNTQQGKDIGYRLQFETDDKEEFLYMQEKARKCIDNTFKDDTVRHGHWIFEGCSVENYKEQIYRCSKCDRWVSILENFRFDLYEEYPYCHCGAKMYLEEDKNG